MFMIVHALVQVVEYAVPKMDPKDIVDANGAGNAHAHTR